MTGAIAGVWIVIKLALDAGGAVAAAAAAIWLWPKRARLGPAGPALPPALALTALWAVCLMAGQFWLAAVAESLRNLAWLFVVYRLFSGDGRHQNLAPIRPVLIALAFVELLHILVVSDAGEFLTGTRGDPGVLIYTVLSRLLVCVGALVLLHNLYAGASRETRAGLRWPTAALACLWGFDLNLYTVVYLAGRWPIEIDALRGLASLVATALIVLGAHKDRDALRLRPSRAVTFQTISLLVIGVYLIAMVAIAQWLSFVGGDFARLIGLAFLIVASAVAVLVLPSKRLRGWLKVSLTKHLFQHRYDYREEWLRFTQTIGAGGAEARPLGERVIQSVADVTDSPAGLLLTVTDHGDLALAARWNWREIEVPATALGARELAFFERETFITDIDSVRSGHDERGELAAVPAWLVDHPRAWAMVPLIHFERLVGMVVLARPPIARKFDWEDFDLLRVVGQQLASYLAENASQTALAESSRFDDFHRRIAFVMHDIKNLASQLSLLARNAEIHADKKAFRDDMLVTLRNSSDKLNALLARLSRYGNGMVDRLGPVDADALVRGVIERFRQTGQVVLSECQPLEVTANQHSLEQVLVHLIQNAIDTSAPGAQVFVALGAEHLNARFEVLDSGSGMSAEFVRNGLFKPFVSTKQGGFGIGAYEARELVRAMRGRLEVESREGLGSRFVVRIPLAAATDIYQSIAGRGASHHDGPGDPELPAPAGPDRSSAPGDAPPLQHKVAR